MTVGEDANHGPIYEFDLFFLQNMVLVFGGDANHGQNELVMISFISSSLISCCQVLMSAAKK
jgi:hypothetical protein